MNTKLFLGMFATASMLFATSCANDDFEDIQSGNEAQVTFSLGLEGGIASRAISDGTGAKKLVYAVYNTNGDIIKTIANADVNGQVVDNAAFDSGLTENVTITLAKGQQYTVVFWAQNPNCTAYTTTDLENVTVDYVGLNNDETRDAFFKAETFTVVGNAEIDVELKRPFAQINVGIYQSDWDAAVASGIEIEKSKATITNAASSINLITGEVAGEETVEYALSTIPAKFDTPETLNVDLDKDGTTEGYVYLSMSYILANDATTGYAKTTLEDLDFTFAPKSGSNINFSEGLSAVPVQRNWRTNIIGKILTGDITFNITIDPIYDGEYNNGEAQPVNINGVYYATIQDAVNNVKDGEVVSIATGTYNEVVDVTNGKTFTIEAAGPDVVIAGINQQTNGAQASNLTVKGITIDNSLATAGWFTGTSPKMFVCVGAWGGKMSFEDCKFIVDGTSKKETGVMTWWTTGLTELSFTNCTFDGNDANARAMQIYGKVDLTVDGCTFNTKKDYTLKYVAADGNVATFTNNIVNNSENFVELGSSAYPGQNYTANIIDNTLGNGVNTHVIANDENQTVNVSGNVSIVAEDLVKDADGNYVASSVTGLTNALQLGASEVVLEEGNYNMPSAVANKTVTISGTKDVVVNVHKDGHDSQNTSNATITFDGVTIQGATTNYRGFPHTKAVNFKNCTIKNLLFLFSTTTFENCIFESVAEHCVWTYGAGDVTFSRCDFTYSDRCVNVYSENNNPYDNVTFDKCKFTTNNAASKGAIEVNSSLYTTGVTVNMNDCVAPEYGDMVYISEWDSTAGAKTTVYVDGVQFNAPVHTK